MITEGVKTGLDNSFDGHYYLRWSETMAFVRVKRRGDKSYYYLVENKREGKKVRQKVLKYLGTTPWANIESTKKGESNERHSKF